MNVCMLAPEFLPVWGGVGTYIIGLVKHLPSNVQVHVVAPIRNGYGKKHKTNVQYDYSKYFGKNVHVHLISQASDTFFYNAVFQNACFNYIPKLVKEQKIDVIHSHTAQMPDLQLMFRKLGVPTVTTVHTTILSQRFGTKISKRSLGNLELSEKATYFMYPALRLAEEFYFSKKRSYISPSYWMKNWLESTGHANGKVTVIPNSVDITDYNPQNDMSNELVSEKFNRKIILYVGRLLAMKGVNTIIDAIPKILMDADKADALFVFAGPGDVTPYLEKVRHMGIENHCLFLGRLSRESTVQLMGLAELVVVPSFLENCPYVVLEAMACGTPVVASRVGGIPEMIADGVDGLLVEPGQPDILATAIVKILSDSSLRAFYGRNAKAKIVDKFSWKANISKYLECYSEA